MPMYSTWHDQGYRDPCCYCNSSYWQVQTDCSFLAIRQWPLTGSSHVNSLKDETFSISRTIYKGAGGQENKNLGLKC